MTKQSTPQYELYAVISTDFSVDATEHLFGLFKTLEEAEQMYEERHADGEYVYIQGANLGECYTDEHIRDSDDEDFGEEEDE